MTYGTWGQPAGHRFDTYTIVPELEIEKCLFDKKKKKKNTNTKQSEK